MYFEKYQSNGGWRWRLKAANHETVATGEHYTSEAGCDNAIRIIRETSAETPVKTV